MTGSAVFATSIVLRVSERRLSTKLFADGNIAL